MKIALNIPDKCAHCNHVFWSALIQFYKRFGENYSTNPKIEYCEKCLKMDAKETL